MDRRARRKGARSQAGAEGEGTRRAGARTQEAFLAALSNNGYASAKEVMMLGKYLSCRSTAQVEQVCPNATEEKSPRQYLPIQIPARHGLMKYPSFVCEACLLPAHGLQVKSVGMTSWQYFSESEKLQMVIR